MQRVVLVTIFLLSLYPATAMAQDSGHPPEHQSLHSKFYQNWMRPDNRAISCCHEKDCAPAQSKMENGAWFSRTSDDEDWVQVPPSRVEHDRDSPDGRSHLCKGGSIGNVNVYCFLPANGS